MSTTRVVLVELEVGAVRVAEQLALPGHIVEDGDVRAGLHVLLHHVVKRGVEDRGGAGDQRIALGGAAHIAQVGADGVEHAGIAAGVAAGDVGRQDEQAVALAVEVPGLAAFQVVHQGVVVALRDQAHVRDVGVDQVAQEHVDDAVSAAWGMAAMERERVRSRRRTSLSSLV